MSDKKAKPAVTSEPQKDAAENTASDSPKKTEQRDNGERRNGDRRTGITRRNDDGDTTRPSSLPKPDILHRAIAKSIDLLLFAAAVHLLGKVGAAMGLLYLAIGDGFWQGQSVGKRLIRLRVLCKEGLRPIGFKESIMRNLTVVFPAALLVLPVVGWIMFLTLGLLVVLVETYLAFHDEAGARLGDIIAQTIVEDKNLEPHADKVD